MQEKNNPLSLHYGDFFLRNQPPLKKHYAVISGELDPIEI